MSIGLIPLQGTVKGVPSGDVYYLVALLVQEDEKGRLASWVIGYNKAGKIIKLKRDEVEVI